MKKLIVFDLDGTLAQSKSALDVEMAALLSSLMRIVKVAVISGGAWPQFEKHIEEMIFIGDALFPGGNDYPAKEAGALAIQVRGPEESKRVIETIIACLGDDLSESRGRPSGSGAQRASALDSTQTPPHPPQKSKATAP